jgi:outer membrane protein OmpA-like peptidoglycan-associated protein
VSELEAEGGIPMKSIHLLGASLLSAWVSACSSSVAPPVELVRARTAYDQASHGQAARLAPDDLQAARDSLRFAEKTFDDQGDSQDTKDMAYAAQRRSEVADIKARTLDSTVKEQERLISEQSLRAQKAKADAEQQALETRAREREQRWRDEQQKRREATAQALNDIAPVREDARGVIMTLANSSLFASSRATLLPSARAKLDRLAEILSQQHSRVRIVGYTDSAGSPKAKEALSQERADAIRDYLVSHGTPSGYVTALGLGPSIPVADNGTKEGRAKNQRVEIVVQNAEQSTVNVE